jgi:trigger factor
MSATVETLEGLERRITLNLNAAEVEAEVGKRLQKLSRNVKIDGFRPGKAPMKMVAARYGAELHDEVLGDALQQASTTKSRHRRWMSPVIRALPRQARAASAPLSRSCR